jgi:SOS-response transcriptional repressor LexA
MAKKYPKLSSILKKLLFEKDMRPIDLSRELNIPQPTIHRLVTGKSTRPYKSSLQPIADFFSITTEQLLGEAPLPETKPSGSPEQAANLVTTLPIIEWNAAENLIAPGQKNLGQLSATGNIRKDCFAVIMNDYSMEPLFPIRTILLFDPNRQATDRSYVLVKLDGINTPIFRQLLVDLDHQYLKPLNPDLTTYQMRLLGKKDRIIASLFESRINHLPIDNPSTLEENHEA